MIYELRFTIYDCIYELSYEVFRHRETIAIDTNLTLLKFYDYVTKQKK